MLFNELVIDIMGAVIWSTNRKVAAMPVGILRVLPSRRELPFPLAAALQFFGFLLVVLRFQFS
jgi:hypothetical protein